MRTKFDEGSEHDRRWGTAGDRKAIRRSRTNPSLSAIRRITLRSICSWQAKNDRTRQISSEILNASNALSLPKGYFGFIFWYAAMAHFMSGTPAMF
ncbi:MAG: hypothetical protein ACSHYA_02380 [Opitutaceae bacterium]